MVAVHPLCLSTNITVSSSLLPHSRKPHNANANANANVTLKSLSKYGKLEEALCLIESSSTTTNSSPELQVYATLLHACISTKSLQHGQRLYLQLLLLKHQTHLNLLNNPTLITKFITLFSVCGKLDEALRIFQDTLENGPVHQSVWVAMAVAYSRNGYPKEALLMYSQMLRGFIKPGNFAFSMALKASSDLPDLCVGRAIHAQIVKSNQDPDQVVSNALLGLYAGCGCFEDALNVFDEMPQRNIVSWNSLIGSFVGRDDVFKSFGTFRKMQEERIGFSLVTLTMILPVCGRVTALRTGKEVHTQMMKSNVKPDVPLLNSLMDMYAKCGDMRYCRRVFDGMHSRDMTSWNTLLTGYSINGRTIEAMELFDKMIDSGRSPDGVTFIAMLSGCSHAGLTEYGQRLFNKMGVDFGVTPNLEHYACLVDILGRSGRIKEALEVVESMPMTPGGSIWGSLLNSCRLYGNVALGEVIAKHLFEIEPNNAGNYVMLSNIYANAEIWEGMKMVRETMERKGLKKEAGCSWIQIENRIHTFVAGGGFGFSNSDEYRKVWKELMESIEGLGYVADKNVVLHDIDDGMKVNWVCGHSERLATMYALINTSSGMPIRITKNLRVCIDCHIWMKFVSRVTHRLIVLRDTNRFHHFDAGACSCKDYW